MLKCLTCSHYVGYNKIANETICHLDGGVLRFTCRTECDEYRENADGLHLSDRNNYSQNSQCSFE